ncbi:hypothetical protein [Terrisporobacter sp.]
MKVVKFIALFTMLVLSTGLITTKQDNIPLTREELKYIFPDDNFRRVVYSYFPNEDITLSKLKNLDGEFYASNENIKNIEGISKLEGIDSFILWNNNIQYLPSEIKRLRDMDYINLANNYLTDNHTISSLTNRGVKVNSDLNFIKDKKYQYELKSKTTNLYLKKGEKYNLKKLLYKSIEYYPKFWEKSTKVPSVCDLIIETNNPTALSFNKGICTAGNKSGKYYIKISLNKDKHPSSTVILKTVVK